MAAALGTFELFRDATESRDADALAALYADDAVMIEYDMRNPPSSPMKLEGKEDIEFMVRDICGREMTHEIGDEVIGEDRFSFTELCEYPDGNLVFSAMVCDLNDGKIARQVGLQAWDE
jgi:ketosteroid isomerase-like protein